MQDVLNKYVTYSIWPGKCNQYACNKYFIDNFLRTYSIIVKKLIILGITLRHYMN